MCHWLIGNAHCVFPFLSGKLRRSDWLTRRNWRYGIRDRRFLFPAVKMTCTVLGWSSFWPKTKSIRIVILQTVKLFDAFYSKMMNTFFETKSFAKPGWTTYCLLLTASMTAECWSPIETLHLLHLLSICRNFALFSHDNDEFSLCIFKNKRKLIKWTDT